MSDTLAVPGDIEAEAERRAVQAALLLPTPEQRDGAETLAPDATLDVAQLPDRGLPQAHRQQRVRASQAWIIRQRLLGPGQVARAATQAWSEAIGSSPRGLHDGQGQLGLRPRVSIAASKSAARRP